MNDYIISIEPCISAFTDLLQLHNYAMEDDEGVQCILKYIKEQ